MVNRPKAIGTAAETAVLRVIKPFYPDTRRVVLHGNDDQGDLHAWMNDAGEPALVVEVKGGAQANQPSDRQIGQWLIEAERERAAANGQFAVLVTQRRGVGAPNAGRWWAWMTLSSFSRITNLEEMPESVISWHPVRLQLTHLLELLYAEGWMPRA